MSLLAIHPGALGDVILLGHLLRGMEGHKTLVAGGEKADLLAGMGIVDAAMDYDSLPMEDVFGEAPLTVGRLSRKVGKHERIVSFMGADDERVQRRLREASGAGSAVFLPVRPPVEWNGHIVELWASRMGEGDRVQLPSPAWHVPSLWTDLAAAALSEAGRTTGEPFAVIHPGAGSPAKCWPLERFGAIADALEEEGLEVVVALGPVERERWGDEALRSFPQEVLLLDCPPLATLAGALAGAELYVGNDSGTSHLAAAVGTNTLALFGSTRSEHFRPLGPSVRVIQAGTMEEIAIQRVRGEALRWASH